MSMLRVAVVQLNPKLGQVQANIQRARDLCNKLQPKSLDLVCFPEMAFTGYMFDDAAAATPHLEEPRTGPTSQFCAELAKKLNCYVLAGYPELLSPTDRIEPTHMDPEKSCEDAVGANSAVMFGREGEWITGYRKTNLFDTDMTWAKAGTGFASLKLPPPLNSTSIGICMDLNPERGKSWNLLTGPYEIADHCIQSESNLLIMLNSWLESSESQKGSGVDGADWDTLEYWAARLRPLWAEEEALQFSNAQPQDQYPLPPSDTTVVLCNRSGSEGGKTFAGTSALFKLTKGSGKPVLLDMMKKDEEGIAVWHVPV